MSFRPPSGCTECSKQLIRIRRKGKRAFFKDMALALVMPNDKAPSLAPSFEKPPGSEPDNPTVLPFEVLKTYRWTFIIRHPRSSIPSLYRLSMPASGEATGWHYYLPQEAGYRELRVLFDYLLSHKLIEPNHVCLIDADDLIAQPAKIIERYCKYIGIDYRPEMLRWNTEEDKAHADEVFASPKWIAFHRDALESTGFYARKEIKVSVRILFFFFVEYAAAREVRLRADGIAT